METIQQAHFPDIAPMPDRGYRTVVADPPWAYDDDLDHEGAGASSQYETMTRAQVMALGQQVNNITAGHSHLYLWTTNAFVGDAHDVARAWGFTPKTMVTWCKVTDAPETLPHEREDDPMVNEYIGMGRYVCNATEHILVCAKGTKLTNRNDVPSYFFAERGEHSSKPEKSYRLVEQLSDGPFLELFARSSRDGWDAWGKEV